MLNGQPKDQQPKTHPLLKHLQKGDKITTDISGYTEEAVILEPQTQMFGENPMCRVQFVDGQRIRVLNYKYIKSLNGVGVL